MNNIADYLDQLQRLTQRNLEILQAINDSFFTKNNHIAVKIGDTNYAMPSFLSLENKINVLQESLNNLVNAPTTGEAYFNMDGNSRSIEVRGYTHTPNSIKLKDTKNFSTYKNNIFKDFLSPVPYINIDLYTLPNDITSVNIKKVIPKHPELVDRFKSLLGESTNPSKTYTWADLYKILSIYKKDIDYTEYNSIKKLPIRENIGSGTYVIESILEDYIDREGGNMENYIRLKLRSDLEYPYMKDLTYRLFNETIYKQLKEGDELVTYDDSAKMKIVDLDPSSNTILVKVLNGEYLNLGQTNLIKDESKTGINDICKIKFYSPIDFNKDKYIRVPLEEDQYVFVAVAPLNDRMNIQSSWGSGLLLNTFNLKLDTDENLTFKNYYDNNVRNIGDILFEMTSTMTNTVTSLSPIDFNKITNIIPEIDLGNIEVTQINNHLNDSETVKNIRSLYSQKNIYKTELNEVQTSIDNINKELASISFDDTSGTRSVYISQLTENNNKKNELITSISKIIDEISLAANNSEVPIENAKYRIRGFFDYENFINKYDEKLRDHIKGIQVQYRYKNIDQPQGTAQTINDSFLFSDWNIMNGFYNPKISKYINGVFKFENIEDNSNKNEPSFNQIDIPISQGETVDIKLKVIYDYGYPFVETSSQWSDIVNIKFPSEFLKNVQVLDIIEENNNDIETNRFKNIIKEQGIPSHIEDKIIDQDLTYFHRPESISSGFYTSERRIIPLKDKLFEMANNIISLQDELAGTSADAIDAFIMNGDISNKLSPYQINNIVVESYNIFTAQTDDKITSDGLYNYDPKTGIVSTTLNLVLSNVSKHTVKLFSLFPGSRNNSIGSLLPRKVKFPQVDFESSLGGVWLKYDKSLNKESNAENDFKLQTANQFITFRIKDVYNGDRYYTSKAEPEETSLPLEKEGYEDPFKDKKLGMLMYPNIREEFALCLNSDSVRSFIQLTPGENIIIPIYVEYKLRDIITKPISKSDQEVSTIVEPNKLNTVSKTMSFDLRTSLYDDPINYTFKVTAKLDNTTQDKLITSNRKFISNVDYKSTVIK